jgi:signal transduction histidine kinase
MRVEIPRSLSVLSHELRGPLSVIQGYLRLLGRDRDRSDPESRMIDAMKQATAKLALLGRQVSDFGALLQPTSVVERADWQSLRIDELIEKALGSTASLTARSEVGDDVRELTVVTPSPDALVAALTALTEFRVREAMGDPVIVTASADGTAVTILIRDQPTPGSEMAPVRADVEPGDVPFDRGGQGLALVLASYVLDQHGAQVWQTAGPATIHVRLSRQQ